MKHWSSALFICILLGIMAAVPLTAAKLTGVAVLDRDTLLVTFIDGEVKFKDDAAGKSAFDSTGSATEDNWIVSYGPLDTGTAANPGSWKIGSLDDPAFAAAKSPARVCRKSKINGMAQLQWDTPKNDFHYETTLEHKIYLVLPAPLQQGKHYTLTLDPKLDPSRTPQKFEFDVFQSRSEAVHLNLVGFMASPTVRACDLYQWMGDGGARDYSKFVGAKVWVYDVASKEKTEAGTVKLWKKEDRELGGYDFTGSDVWSADFTGFDKPGTYRVAVDGVGCSQDFSIAKSVYRIPYGVSVKGFYYMRIGEAERSNIRPIPRQPLYLPGKSPADTKVVITTMQPFHPDWEKFTGGDKWDAPNSWSRYAKKGRPENNNAWGGHSDALDWDRHLGHVSIIYDMLLPYLLTDGALSDDDTGIAESGNGIPDILDEARNEVDFWLRLRDGEGYSHGLTNPNKENILYQAGITTVAAWANAANAAMLADCFRIAKLEDLKTYYLGQAVIAYKYASKQKDQQLDKIQGVGDVSMHGSDFRMTAAAFLFNLTGDRKYEKDVASLSLVGEREADVNPKTAAQIWATAGYLLTPQKIGNPGLYERMRNSVVAQARSKETSASGSRPSRRSSDAGTGYFYTAQNVHRTLVAHRISKDPKDRQEFLDALILEADWGLGRNPLNMIQMTTATTPLAGIRSVENAYTSGRNDGTPGLHPGHTPYLNTDNWWDGMIMAKPQWMASQGYPEFAKWPHAECYYNSRWVWAHSEFTPQQTMRGKMALYGYLYGIDK